MGGLKVVLARLSGRQSGNGGNAGGAARATTAKTADGMGNGLVFIQYKIIL